MRSRRVGTLTLGILFILLGLIFLLNHTMNIPLENWLKWWPIGIILLGLEILVFSYTKVEGRKFDALSFMAILLVIVVSGGVGLLGDLIQGKNVLGVIGIQPYLYDSSFDKKISINAQGKNKLTLDNYFGDVKIEKGSSNEIKIDANIKMRNNDEEYAKKIAVESAISVQESSTIQISSQSINNIDRKLVESIRISYIVQVPEGISVEVKNKFGGVNLDSISADVSIKNEHGAVEVKNVGGSLYVENSFGKTQVSKIKGKAEIQLKHGEMIVKDINESLIAKDEFGAIQVENVKGSVNISNKNGGINIIGVTGDLKVENRFGEISVRNVDGKVMLTGQNGSLNLELNKLTTKDIVIENKFGEIALKLNKDQTGIFKVFTRYGIINSDFNSNILKATNEQSLEHAMGNSQNQINIRNENGNVRIIRW